MKIATKNRKATINKIATKNKLVQPFLKWAGGKRQLLPIINEYIPEKIHPYYEPFIGAGALLFHLQPERAFINDANKDLINVYKVIKHHVKPLIEELEKHKHGNNSEHFYKVRNIDRVPERFDKLTYVEKAARIIYLNKTCFNGLFRVNKKGEFNVPFGKFSNPNICNDKVLAAVNDYLTKHVQILQGDFEEAVITAGDGDFVYFDPPYDPVSETSSFTSYSEKGFTKEDQIRLRDLCVKLDKKGVKFLLSNSATDFIVEKYNEKGFIVEKVEATRNINSVATKRGKIDEVLVRNYE